ncbi:nuclear envelope phosphatase-regulatory subunit 1 homolog [Condylostylus longicornis]|uniref:nuclear envelope phosphatase-regulatory subunit 1 homolog n=1 Tax=Condylostylus longicornis TaxID=2530218 RepID=UPI00244DBE13|nr:nuclear envelope phosphatase-regulatory subunit 1 homolog [Condylostylus longicornis]
MESSACEDLKAFERRLTEVVASYYPSTIRWRILLAIVSICTATGAWYWLRDPNTSILPLPESLWYHPVFFCATLSLIILFLFGIHKLVIAPQIITSRMRSVLADFNMSCDDTGKLILKPRPNN